MLYINNTPNGRFVYFHSVLKLKLKKYEHQLVLNMLKNIERGFFVTSNMSCVYLSVTLHASPPPPLKLVSHKSDAIFSKHLLICFVRLEDVFLRYDVITTSFVRFECHNGVSRMFPLL